jgi:hypothetical protein
VRRKARGQSGSQGHSLRKEKTEYQLMENDLDIYLVLDKIPVAP